MIDKLAENDTVYNYKNDPVILTNHDPTKILTAQDIAEMNKQLNMHLIDAHGWTQEKIERCEAWMNKMNKG